MSKALFINGNEAIAYGVKAARPDVIAAYPITPQTKAVEKLSQFVQDGEMETIYMHVESEHSAMACSIGASGVGARTFTATSSQGLLYMAECLPYASGARLPIVMMNANRSVATPWNIYGDQMDAMFMLNAGWVQLFVENGQEALDMVLQSYRIAEHPEIMAPVMINIDGFVLTHTYEKVLIPDQDLVDAFLPKFIPQPHMMTDENPMSMCITAGNAHNMEFKVKQHLDLLKAEAVLEDLDLEFHEKFGRSYGGAMEAYRCEDADRILITTGSVTGTARVVVDALRASGESVGLLKLRLLRPFPTKALIEAVKSAKTLAVLDKNISFGYEGTVFTNVNSALQQMGSGHNVLNFIGGLGGRDITKDDLTEVYEKMKQVDAPRVQYVGMRCTL